MSTENENELAEELQEDGASSAPAARMSSVRPVDPGSVHVLFEPETTKVVLTGEIDAELGPDLLEAAEDALSSSRPIEVDSHLVTFMDSTGVAFLARLASRASRRVMLVDPPDVVGFLIETTRISSLLDVVHRNGGTPEQA
jgi:anti-sigma B factor antagonist